MHRLMVVEDDAIIALRLKELLTSMGYEVAGTAGSGEEAVRLASRLKPDLVLMDIKMPGRLDGVDAAERIGKNLDIPVIFLTAYANEALINRALEVEPSGYVLKPIRKWEISTAIEVALHKKDTERRLRKGRHELEEEVNKGTVELMKANEELQAKSHRLEELNTALRVLLESKEVIGGEIEHKVQRNVNKLVLPFLERLKKQGLDEKQRACVNILESNLRDIISRFSSTLSSRYLTLTPAEMEIANLIKEGKSTKAIAGLLGVSTRTVETHRKNIRKKMDLTGKTINLRTYLLSLH